MCVDLTTARYTLSALSLLLVPSALWVSTLWCAECIIFLLFDLKLGTTSATGVQSLEACEKAARAEHLGTISLMLLSRFIFLEKETRTFSWIDPDITTSTEWEPLCECLLLQYFGECFKTPCRVVIDLIFPLAQSCQSHPSSVKVNCCNKVLFMLPDRCGF